MDKIKKLMDKSIDTIKTEGFKAFYTKVKRFTLERNKKDKKNVFKDILFINGCKLPNSQMYRIKHQMEQLESMGLFCDRLEYEKIDKNIIKYYRGFVFFRCPKTGKIKEFIEFAKSKNKTVFYDTDDFNEELDGKMLKMCDYAITTNEKLAEKLKNYIKEVYINPNVASEEMTELFIKAIKEVKKDDSKIIMSYLSENDDDFKSIIPAIQRVMKENQNVYLKLDRLLKIPEELQEFKNRILNVSITSWRKLPKTIASIDINLVPLEKTIFNETKSENEWIEFSLCKAVTVASNFGTFKTCITDGIDGILCNNTEEWYNNLTRVIKDKKYREEIADNAFKTIIKSKITTYTGLGIYNFIQNRLNKNIAFVLPSTNLSGGINVAIRHCNILKKAGYDAFFINADNNDNDLVNKDGNISVIKQKDTDFKGQIDTMVATLWTTLQFVKEYPNTKNKSYLVQGFETDFFNYGSRFKAMANATYNSFMPINYLTVSKWCENWLKNNYNKICKYAPNGIDIDRFPYKDRNFEGKIKILVEGNCTDEHKNVDESFKIVEKLDKNKYEITFLSYQGEPKDWYYVDNFMHKVPYDEVGKVYANTDILIKSSILESFSYPPIEMMATGGIVVVVPNDGNIEYLKDEYNCLFYEQGNINQAVNQIERIINDKNLRDRLIKNGQETAKSRQWSNIEKDIINLYFEEKKE